MKDAVKFIASSLFGAVVLAGVSNIADTVTMPVVAEKPLRLYVAPEDKTSDWRQVECRDNVGCNKLAEAVFFEGRGEPLDGQYAIAYTVVNRRDASRWPDTVKDVVNQKKNGVCQFSYICQLTAPRRAAMIAAEPHAWDVALKVAHKVFFFEVEDVTGGADHYHATYVDPGWAKRLEYVAQLGDHIFYKSEARQ